MTDDEIRSVLREILTSIAPEIDGDDIDPTEDLRDELDIDSMDFLRFLEETQKRFGIRIPEADSPKLQTLDDATAYVAAARAEST
jgi:acyl carrier protein